MNRMPSDKIMFTCPVCGQQFQFGPHRYAGTHIRTYDMTVCETCYRGNWDGWQPDRETWLLDRLKSKSLPIPKRNARGLLPRE
jgi:hypothetical protein